MRFQALMPDILQWLGIKKIDRMLSMSNMKHDAIVEQGIPILERIPIPDRKTPFYFGSCLGPFLLTLEQT
jgi:GTP cyclohydrolase II